MEIRARNDERRMEMLTKKLQESLVGREENVNKLISEFIGETESDPCFEYMADSISLTQTKLKERKISSIASFLDWNWWQKHTFSREKIIDFAQIFALSKYARDPSWRKERRIKICLDLLLQDDTDKLFDLFELYYSERTRLRREKVFSLSRKGNGLLSFDQVRIGVSSIPNSGSGLFVNADVRRGQALFLYGAFCFDHDEEETFTLIDKKFGDYGFEQNFGYDPASGQMSNPNVFPPFVEASLLPGESDEEPERRYLHVGQFINQNFDLKKVNCSSELFDWAPLCCVELNRYITKTVVIVAARNIKKGEELFINYGYEYWKGIELPDKWKTREEYKQRFEEFKKELKTDSKGSLRDAFEDWLMNSQ